MANTFIMRKEWLDNIKSLSIEQQDRILADIVRYGVNDHPAHADDPVVEAFVNMVKARIDVSKQVYEEKVEMSKNAGKKASVDKAKIYECAKLGFTAKETAKVAGCSQSTVLHSEEWKKGRAEVEKSRVQKNEPENQKLSVFDF